MFFVSNRQLVVIFIILMAVSAFFLLRGYSKVETLRVEAKSIISKQHSKERLLSSMYASARERSLLLMSMLVEDDPFELDDLNQKMGENARIFIRARADLMAMQLSKKEKDIFAQQQVLTSKNAPLQNKVAEYFLEGNKEPAEKLLLSTAVPGQTEVLNKIKEIIDLNNKTTAKAVEKIDLNFLQASQNFQILGVVLIGTSTIFIVFSMLISRQEKKRLQILLEKEKKVSEELDKAAEKLSYQASHDPLTGLLGRREFENRIAQMLHRAEEGCTHAVLYLDLDQFKVVNDTSGHSAGDQLLREISTVMHTCIRKSDALARLGGDEFGILLEYCELDLAEKLSQEIINKIGDFRFRWDTKTFRIGISIGITLIDDKTTSLEEVLKHVDSACYAAKDAGRHRYQVYRPDDKELSQRESELDWVVRLDRALEQNRFELYVQPIKALQGDTSERLSYEVLIRLRSDDGKIILPGAFLPAAERYNKMVDIDRWVVTETMRVFSENPGLVRNIGYCSINLSGQSLTSKQFLNFLVEQLSLNEDVARHICLEVTETAAINSMFQAVKAISIVRGMGVRFALDDFGSGLSSFEYLKRLPVDFLKIDGMFVRDMLDDNIDRAMVKTIHEIGTLMGKQTIAEFVENEDILAEVENIGVNYAQGYGVGRPVPFEEIYLKPALEG